MIEKTREKNVVVRRVPLILRSHVGSFNEEEEDGWRGVAQEPSNQAVACLIDSASAFPRKW